MSSFRHLGDHLVHRGHVWNVVVGEFEAPDGRRFERDIVRSPGAVGVVPILFDPEGRASVVLVQQYRPSCGVELVEIPAGMRDVPGEPIEETAQRELAEEVGLTATTFDHLVRFHPSPGMTDSITEIFLATGCTRVDKNVQGPEEEYMTELHIPLDVALSMIDDGSITDAKTVLGLFTADRRLRCADGRLDDGTTTGSR